MERRNGRREGLTFKTVANPARQADAGRCLSGVQRLLCPYHFHCCPSRQRFAVMCPARLIRVLQLLSMLAGCTIGFGCASPSYYDIESAWTQVHGTEAAFLIPAADTRDYAAFRSAFARGLDSARQEIDAGNLARCQSEPMSPLWHFQSLQEDSLLQAQFNVATLRVFTDYLNGQPDEAFWVGFCTRMDGAIAESVGSEFSAEAARLEDNPSQDVFGGPEQQAVIDAATERCDKWHGVARAVVEFTPRGEARIRSWQDGYAADSLELLRLATHLGGQTPIVESRLSTFEQVVFPSLSVECQVPGWSIAAVEGMNEPGSSFTQ